MTLAHRILGWKFGDYNHRHVEPHALGRQVAAALGMSPDTFVLKGGAEYFTANIADDERHREEMPQLVALWLSLEGTDLGDAECMKTALEPVRAGAHYSADLRQKFFEGIHACRQRGGTFLELVEP